MECPTCGESWGERCAEIYNRLLDNWMAERGVAFPEDDVLIQRTACRTAATEHQVADDRPDDLPDTPPPARSHDTPDWEHLKHWKYCVGGRYEEVRRKTIASAADDVIKGFKIGAAAVNLIPVVGQIVSAAIVGLGWTLGKLGLFTSREPAYKVVRGLFAQMFKKDLNIPLIGLTREDWAIAIPEVSASAIFEIVESFRKHTFDKLGMTYKIWNHPTFIGAKWKSTAPASIISDKNTRHFLQCVDWLHVYEVTKIPNKIEWIFAFGAADEHSWELCRRGLTNHDSLYRQELDQMIEEGRQQGGTNGGDDPPDEPPDEPKNGNGVEDGEGSNLLLPLAIFIAALIYFRDRK